MPVRCSVNHKAINAEYKEFVCGAMSSRDNATADIIYLGGDIITLDDTEPSAEAVAVKNGKILAVGNRDQISALRGNNTKIVDLLGKTLIPGFVDAHGHAYGVGGQAIWANLLPPPEGEGSDIPALQRILRQYTIEHSDIVKQTGWIVGFGYDESQLSEHRHPIREELDAVSKDLPVYVIHPSGHLGVANGRALQLVGYTAGTPNPPGGVIRRGSDGREPNGVLEENAHFVFLSKILSPDPEFNEAVFLKGVERYASYGYTTAQEGNASSLQVEIMAGAAQKGKLPIDVVVYPNLLSDKKEISEPWLAREYKNHFRVGGGKLILDGSPQAKTAWRDRPYYIPPEGHASDYLGYPAASNEQVLKAMDEAFANNWQVLTHANGEAAIDLLIAAVREATKKHGPGDRRPVLIHGQFMREDQVDPLKELGIFPSLFPNHTYYWGDWHREQTVGPQRADNISPTGWVMIRGMKFTSHHDAPVSLPDSMRVLEATVTRRTRSGDILGPCHRVPVITALKAMTLWAAYQHFEEDSKGSIEAGKLADFVVLSNNPTKVDQEKIHTIKVLETIKEGRTVYKA
jgi:predicted amidohydrolase YtcJ